MEAQEDSLLSPITAAADLSDSTTMLVSEGAGLPQILQQAFDNGACPPPLALLAQVLQLIAGYKIPVANLSYPARGTELVFLLSIIDNGSVCEEFPQIPNSWQTLLCHTAASALNTLRHLMAGSLQSLAGATASPPSINHMDPHSNLLDQQQRAFHRNHC